MHLHKCEMIQINSFIPIFCDSPYISAKTPACTTMLSLWHDYIAEDKISEYSKQNAKLN